jgi:hypothetical protein
MRTPRRSDLGAELALEEEHTTITTLDAMPISQAAACRVLRGCDVKQVCEPVPPIR